MNTSRPCTIQILVLGMTMAIVLGCTGGSAAPNGSTVAAANDEGPRLELGIRLSDGRWLELGDLRGTPVLLFVFATFDMVSQAALAPLRPFVQQHPEVLVVGVASEPRATQLVEAWAYALDPPFVVGADPYGGVENARTALGRIERVPTYILYDAAGYEMERVTGYQAEADLEAMVSALSPRR